MMADINGLLSSAELPTKRGGTVPGVGVHSEEEGTGLKRARKNQDVDLDQSGE